VRQLDVSEMVAHLDFCCPACGERAYGPCGDEQFHGRYMEVPFDCDECGLETIECWTIDKVLVKKEGRHV